MARSRSESCSGAKRVAEHWSKLNFGQILCETVGDFHNFRVQVYLDELEHDAVSVELYAQPRNGEPPVRQPMSRGACCRIGRCFHLLGQVPSSRPAADYTPRIVPAFRDAQVPLEAKEILWQR